MLEQLRRPELAEALLLAAPGLAREAQEWLAAPLAPPSPNLERSLVRYFSRMCTRCTPFGTFAGVTVLAPGERSQLELAPLARYRRKTRIDNGLLFEICRSAAADR